MQLDYGTQGIGGDMKKGDLVRYSGNKENAVGIVVDVIQKKVWRTSERGKAVNWNRVEPEPHAVVLWEHNDGPVAVPVTDLWLI